MRRPIPGVAVVTIRKQGQGSIMSRVSLGLITATFASLMAIDSAAAGGCSFRPFGSCGSGYYYAQPQYVAAPVYVQPAPQVVQVTPPPIVVQVAQPQVIVQQVAVEQPVQMYVVNQGPVYSGPNLTDYADQPYYEPRRARSYPYISGGYRWNGYRRPYVSARPYVQHHRPYWKARKAYHSRYHHPIRRYY